MDPNIARAIVAAAEAEGIEGVRLREEYGGAVVPCRPGEITTAVECPRWQVFAWLACDLALMAGATGGRTRSKLVDAVRDARCDEASGGGIVVY